MLVKDSIEKATNLQVNLTTENERCKVNFLDCTMKRNEDSTISFKWYKKEHSSFSILNFHSFHTTYVKANAVKEMIRKACLVTSNESFEIVVIRCLS